MDNHHGTNKLRNTAKSVILTNHVSRGGKVSRQIQNGCRKTASREFASCKFRDANYEFKLPVVLPVPGWLYDSEKAQKDERKNITRGEGTGEARRFN